MSNLEAIGRQVREARKKQGVSQEELALMTGLSRRPIYLLESGKGGIQLDNFLTILKALGMRVVIQPRGGLTPDDAPAD